MLHLWDIKETQIVQPKEESVGGRCKWTVKMKVTEDGTSYPQTTMESKQAYVTPRETFLVL